MSRDRAQRRQVQEQERARAAEAQQRRDAKAAKRRAWGRSLAGLAPRPTRWRKQQGLLARRRRLQNGSVAALAVLVLLLLFLLTDSWWLRLAGVVAVILSLPVLVTLVFDRRTRS